MALSLSGWFQSGWPCSCRRSCWRLWEGWNWTNGRTDLMVVVVVCIITFWGQCRAVQQEQSIILN